MSFANFWEPNAFSDPRCLYDASTRTFFFSVIGFDNNNNTTVDIAVYNARGFKVYQFDTSLGGTQFGDQPHIGYDDNAFYVSTDEFPLTGPDYNGAILVIISKPQLVAQSATVSSATTGLLSLAGEPVLTLQPAISTSPTTTEYLLNSFFQNLSNNKLGYWTVTNDTNPANAVVRATTIASETYVFPVPALSTGTGQTTGIITSEDALNPDDARMQQVQFIHGHLWGALTTSLLVDNDPTPRDGLAWFKINTYTSAVEQQGYVGSLGNYLIYPAIFHTRWGLTAIAFTLTSKTINPSAAYVVNNFPKKFAPLSFGEVSIAAYGSGPHYSFSQALFGERRWGDYSAAALDLNGNSIWLATEYIPVFQSLYDNWGTRVFEVGPKSHW
ncbi:hypothetical protein KDH_57960 [Dictyobacter sp. S3.2.2.5]|uniref:Uncharacterized protein n=1 Tax=Dictyobacter halimunensis TaxID=3026934 RepID=A0ABQ6G132_9CHLR|nr:hypothetical protein KDH_57960 [Dictyobacter sp. S3.2.2.5]